MDQEELEFKRSVRNSGLGQCAFCLIWLSIGVPGTTKGFQARWFLLTSTYLYYYSRLVTPAIFTHRTPTTMYGVSMEPLWPPDHNLIGGFGVPASWGLGGTKEFWREIQNF